MTNLIAVLSELVNMLKIHQLVKAQEDDQEIFLIFFIPL
jgi:hypothetical protein